MKCFTFLLLAGLSVLSVNAQKQIKISGSVYDAHSKETLPTATLLNGITQKGTITNAYGDFQMQVQEGVVHIEASFMGYQTLSLQLDLHTDTMLNIVLVPGIELAEATVTASKEAVSAGTTPGLLKLPVSAIEFAPSFAGENNLITTLKTLPGVSAGKEGGSELYVRGGRFDQNLILLDGSPVYNLSHAFGLLSVFNASTIKNVNLYKGAIPAEYGGRLSSVLDVSVREGHKNEYHGDIGVSTLAAAFTFEGPIVKEKASFLVSARRSWPDLLVLAAMSSANDAEFVPGIYFNDINAKVNFTCWDKHHFYLSYYTGQDEMFVRSKYDGSDTESSQGWGNHLATMRWNTKTKGGSLLNASAHYSRFFDYNRDRYNSETVNQWTKQEALMEEIGLKFNAERTLNGVFSIKAGVEGLVRIFSLPSTEYESGSNYKLYDQGTQYQNVLAAYGTLLYSKNQWSGSIGLRASMFGEAVNDYFFMEPRLALNYRLNDEWTLKAGAMYNVQPLYAMTKANHGFPGYTWLPLSGNLKPQTAYQVSAGFHYNPLPNLHVDLEGYFKRSYNVAGNYMYSTTVYPANEWYKYINQGDGIAYGTDVLIEYRRKKWDVKLGYSLAESAVRIDEINFGNWFPFEYDIRHDLNIAGSWQFQSKEEGKKWLTYNYAIHSGTPVTLPSQSIQSIRPLFPNHNSWYTERAAAYYSHPNNYRLRPYHRLDVAINMEKYKKRGSRIWSLGLMNAYCRMNPYIIYQDGNQFKELVMFPILPVVSFKRTF
nr:carboxypeptidase-like regulatory domain-containing protein [uncultured Carboxylicivirga sp.]